MKFGEGTERGGGIVYQATLYHLSSILVNKGGPQMTGGCPIKTFIHKKDLENYRPLSLTPGPRNIM